MMFGLVWAAAGGAIAAQAARTTTQKWSARLTVVRDSKRPSLRPTLVAAQGHVASDQTTWRGHRIAGAR
jgi:hypothetical protein